MRKIAFVLLLQLLGRPLHLKKGVTVNNLKIDLVNIHTQSQPIISHVYCVSDC